MQRRRNEITCEILASHSHRRPSVFPSFPIWVIRWFGRSRFPSRHQGSRMGSMDATFAYRHRIFCPSQLGHDPGHLAVGRLLIAFVSRDAAGSGIPQLKIAFWRDFGFLPIKVALVKFFAGIITIGGGCSFGREGPTVHIAGALASNIAGILGVAKQGRRPALLSGAAAGLAAAFNTPLSAITFVMEEIVEDLNNRGYLAQVLIASVTATFVCHIFLGEDPAFVIPSISHFSGILYLLVIPAAGLAALAGAAFQKGTLIWRDKIKRIKRIPFFLKPAVGVAMNWMLGIWVFFAIGKIGVFGLG